MHYLIQENVFKDPRYDQIFVVLETLNLPYETVRFHPNSVVFDYHTTRQDIFVYGSVKLAKVAAGFDWAPGSLYGGNHAFERYAAGYGNNVINHDSYLGKFTDELDWRGGSRLFIKPSKEAKVFTGRVYHEVEWRDFVHNTLNDPSNHRVTADTAIQASTPYALIKEARTWIVDGRVVTSSYYKFHGDLPFEPTLAEDGLAFATRMAQLYAVADAYVMDIALTLDGWKIVEINCINSAGFYRGDVHEIVLALEAFYG